MTELKDTIEIGEDIYDYLASKGMKGVEINRFMASKGLDNPHLLKKRNIEEWKSLIDKILLFRGMMKNDN